jgi:hypothetical protein
MNELLQHAHEAEAQFAEEDQFKARSTAGSYFTPTSAAPTPAPSSHLDFRASSLTKPEFNGKKSAHAASCTGFQHVYNM